MGVNKGKSVDMMCLDFQNALDNAPHKKFLHNIFLIDPDIMYSGE